MAITLLLLLLPAICFCDTTPNVACTSSTVTGSNWNWTLTLGQPPTYPLLHIAPFPVAQNGVIAFAMRTLYSVSFTGQVQWQYEVTDFSKYIGAATTDAQGKKRIVIS
jgi:hypothetical protein